ncbi:hypothetical protein L1987_40423 [Smallanthus sonchifolius]|uniref:Uncharacterized protein n=1 Tax=Smallanthus sonchifolius TaxID=185202 RepID=A0ACB9GUB2_9ASTR|nr:hypothetical protein L1987_40423 [Smallanthus sonchifolius]
MAPGASSLGEKDTIVSNSETFCSTCISVKDKMMRVMDDNINLICDMKSMHTVNRKLKDNENVCVERIESLKWDISSLTLKIKEQAYHLDMSFVEIEKRNNDLAEKDKKLAESKAEVIRLHRKLESFGNSSFLLGYFYNTEEGKRTSGIGYVPPPFNENYSVTPEIIKDEDLDPKTVLKVSLVTVEDGLSESENDTEPVIVAQKGEADNDVFMAPGASSLEEKDTVVSNSETFCSTCISVKDKMMRVMDDNINLICDMKSMHTVNRKLKDHENVCVERIESLKRNEIMILLRKDKERAESKEEVIRLHRKLESFGNSSFLLGYFNNTEEGKRTSGIGYVPPPFNENYSVTTEIIKDEDLDPKTVLKKFDHEMKTCETLTMSLPKEIIHSLGKCPTSRDLWEALKKKGEETSQAFVVLIKEVLEKQGDSQSDSSTDFADSEIEDDLSESENDTEPVIVAQKGEADDDVFMAPGASSLEEKDTIVSNSETFCSTCISVKDKMMRVMDDNINLICDMKSMHTVNRKLKDNENVCVERIESLKWDISSLTLKIKEQAYHLDMSFVEIEKRNNDLAEKDKKLAESKAEVIRLHRKLESFGNSSFLLGYFYNTEEGKRTSGIGYVPPPFNENYSVTPEIIKDEDLDPKTVLKVSLVTVEDGLSESENDTEPVIVAQKGEADNDVFMAPGASSLEEKDTVVSNSETFCSTCISVKDKMMRVMDDNINLICDMKSMHTVNRKLKDHENVCVERIESLKRNEIMILLRKDKERAESKEEVIRLHRKLESFGNSSFLLGYFYNTEEGKRTSGIGYVPPPFNENYSVTTEIIKDEDLDPKTVLKKFDHEMKTCETLTMSLPKEIIHSLGKCPTSRDLWEALKKKGEETSQAFVVVIKEVLEKQGDSQSDSSANFNDIRSSECTQSTETDVMTETNF